MSRTKLSAMWSAVAFAAALSNASISPAQEMPYLILAKNQGFSAGFEEAVRAAGGVVQFKLPDIGVAAASSADPEFATKAEAIPELETVVPDITFPAVNLPTGSPGDAAEPAADATDLSYLQWSLDAVQVREAWQAAAATGNPGARGDGARVFVIDGGIDVNHPDLVRNLNTELSLSLVYGETLQYQPGGPVPFAHGSATVGIIAAADGPEGGIAGVAPEAEVVLVKVLRDSTGTASSAACIYGVYYAARNGADVVNMSLSSYFTSSGWVVSPSDPSRSFFVGAKAISAHVNAWKWAVAFANYKGATVVASAANNGIDRDHTADLIHVPGDLPGVIQVSATGPVNWLSDPDTDLDVPAPYTDFGQSVIDLAAPGGNSPYPHPTRAYWPFVLDPAPPAWAFDLVLTSDHNGGWCWVSGTSFSAPYVSGVAALVIANHGGSLHPDQVRTILEKSADDLGKPGNDDFYGAGRVNALRAVMQ